MSFNSTPQPLCSYASPFIATLLLLTLSLWNIPAHADSIDEQMALGKKLFTNGATPPCAICHTLQDAGSEGAIGPVLDELQPDAPRVSKALHDGLGNMPSFKNILSEAEMAALATYVSRASRGQK